MGTVKVTVRLPKEDLEFARRYAQEHRVTLTELIDRYLRRLQENPWRQNPSRGREDQRVGPT